MTNPEQFDDMSASREQNLARLLQRIRAKYSGAELVEQLDRFCRVFFRAHQWQPVYQEGSLTIDRWHCAQCGQDRNGPA